MSSGEQRLRASIRRLMNMGRRAHVPAPGPNEPGWAEHIDTRLSTVERQLKLLNATLITGIIADIAIRLIPK